MKQIQQLINNKSNNGSRMWRRRSANYWWVNNKRKWWHHLIYSNEMENKFCVILYERMDRMKCWINTTQIYVIKGFIWMSKIHAIKCLKNQVFLLLKRLSNCWCLLLFVALQDTFLMLWNPGGLVCNLFLLLVNNVMVYWCSQAQGSEVLAK